MAASKRVYKVEDDGWRIPEALWLRFAPLIPCALCGMFARNQRGKGGVKRLLRKHKKPSWASALAIA
ncbi:MAG: hypothetical protein IT461_12035 [Planctomycetes bacterium]|nr:hypothetical protein [Planctomycetota bacterium]